MNTINHPSVTHSKPNNKFTREVFTKHHHILQTLNNTNTPNTHTSNSPEKFSPNIHLISHKNFSNNTSHFNHPRSFWNTILNFEFKPPNTFQHISTQIYSKSHIYNLRNTNLGNILHFHPHFHSFAVPRSIPHIHSNFTSKTLSKFTAQ